MPYFSRAETNCFKGLLIIFMFVLHFFCYPGWYIDGISYPELSWMEGMAGHFQICISGFSFLTGYLYFFNRNKTLKYSVRKILELYVSYWCVFLPVFIFALLSRTYKAGISGIFLEWWAITQNVLGFSWYVLFYVLAMVALPISVRFLCKNNIIFFGCTMVGAMALYYGASYFMPNLVILNILEKFQVYFPVMVIGYIVARLDLFSTIDSQLNKTRWGKLLIVMFLAVIVFMEPTWLYAGNGGFAVSFLRKCVRVFSIPIFVYAVMNIFRGIKVKAILFIFEELGKKSLSMWFFHCIFFSCSKEITQRLLYFPKYPVLVLVWGLVLSYICAVPLTIVIEKIQTVLFEKSTSKNITKMYS